MTHLARTQPSPSTLLTINFLTLTFLAFIFLFIWQGANVFAYVISLFRSTTPSTDMMIGIAAGGVVSLGLYITAKLGWTKMPNNEITDVLKPNSKRLVVSSIGIGLGSGLSEEILFRGFLLAWIVSFSNAWIGLIVSSLVFGALHVMQYRGHPWIQAYILTFGFVMGGLFVWTGNLWAPFLMHATYNSLVFIMLGSGAIPYAERRGSKLEEEGEDEEA